MLCLKLWWCVVNISASTTQRPAKTVEATKISISTLFLSCSTQKLSAGILSSHTGGNACPWVFLGRDCLQDQTAHSIWSWPEGSLNIQTFTAVMKQMSWKWCEQGAWHLSSYTGTDYAHDCQEQEFLTGESFLGHSQCQRKSRKAWYSWETQGEDSVQVVQVWGAKEHFWLKVSNCHWANHYSQIPPSHILSYAPILWQNLVVETGSGKDSRGNCRSCWLSVL